MSQKVRVRFAPSPTGYLHVGGARTALYSYLFAKKHGGQFVLRAEDTDQERSTEESLLLQIRDLKWLGLYWDEGVFSKSLSSEYDLLSDRDFSKQIFEEKGNLGPYRQSLRLSIYKDYADQLLNNGKAYYCFLTDDEIKEQRSNAMSDRRTYQVKSPYRDLDLKTAQDKLSKGEKAVVRFKTSQEKKDYQLKDLVRGEVIFPSDMVGDFVLLRSSGMPVYNFCCVIDDFLMEMTHVFRAEEHLSNSVRQMMIYEAFNWPLPQFGHLSLILAEDRQKLSKRHGAVSVGHFKERGYLPEALINFLALLGWSSPDAKEILSRDELIQNFSTERLHSAGAVFDNKKLLWMNAHYLRNLDHKILWQKIEPFLSAKNIKFSEDFEWQDRALTVFKTSMELLEDAVELFRPLCENQFKVCEDECKDVLSWETTPQVIQKWIELVKQEESLYMSTDRFVAIQNEIKENCSVKGKQLFMPIRVAVIGKPQGAELKQLVPLLKKEMLLSRATSIKF